MVYVYIPLLHVIWHCRQCVSRSVFHILPCSVTPALALPRECHCCSAKSRSLYLLMEPTVPAVPASLPALKLLCVLVFLRFPAYSCLIWVRCNFTFKISILRTFLIDSDRQFTGLRFHILRFHVFCNHLCVIRRARVAEEQTYKSSINPVLFIHICLKWVLTFPVGHYGTKLGMELLSIVRNWLANL